MSARKKARAEAKQSASIDLSIYNDVKLEKGKKKMTQEAQGWRGPSHKERREEQQESRHKAKIAMNRKAEKVSWKKRVGGICAILFLCGVGLFQFISTIMGYVVGSGVTVLDHRDTATLKKVLFGGEPWLVYCVNNNTIDQRLPKVLEESGRSLRSSLGVKVGVLQCWEQTESGRSVAQRFKLRLSPPLTFMVANGNKPRVVNMVGVSKAEDLEKKLKPALSLGTHRIDTLKKWSSLCTSRRTCVVIGHKQTAQRDVALNVFKPLLESHRTVKVVTLDTSFWQLKLSDAVLATRAAGDKASRGADVLCLARQDSAAGKNSTHRGRFLQELDSRSASAFMTACEQQQDLVVLEATPKIKARPSKPKKVVAPSPRPPSPRPPPPRAAASRANVDRVGSRARLEEQEALFEAVEDEDEEGDEEEGDEEGEEGEDGDAEGSPKEEEQRGTDDPDEGAGAEDEEVAL